MAIRKAQAPALRVPKEAVQVDALGGEVIVHGLRLSDKLRFATWDGPRFAQMAEALAVSVRDADGAQLYTSDEWEVWGGEHMGEAIRLFGVVERLSGLNEAQAEKN